MTLTQELSKPVFDFIDMDGNGWIDEYEFICGLALFAKTTLDDRLEAVYALYDTDRSRALEKDEFSF